MANITRPKPVPAPLAGNAAGDEPIEVDPNQTLMLPIPHADLVLDPELQCRAKGLDQDVIAEYAAAMRAGAEFPAVDVVRVEGRDYLVDGWHREAASRQAGRTTITARVVPGTRFHALKAAAGANKAHGLRRTHEDKRRAVRLLLTDPFYAALSGRKVGEAAGVSHTYVDEVRKHYGLTPGMVLTQAHRERTDGEPNEAWRQLVHGAEKFVAVACERIRKTVTLDELARIVPHSETEHAAVAMRLDEFGTEPRTWADTDAEAKRLVDAIDNEEDCKRALLSVDCPNRVVLLHILADVPALESDYGYNRFDELEEKWRGRKALLERLADARKVRAQKVAGDPYHQGQLIAKLVNDVPAQRAAFLDATRGVQVGMNPRSLAPAIRDHEFRDAVMAHVGPTHDCPDPTCDGWFRPVEATNGYNPCVACNRKEEDIRGSMVTALGYASLLLMVPGYGLATEDGVVLDRDGMKLLQLLGEELRSGQTAWLSKVPADIRAAIKTWASREAPSVLLVNPEGVVPTGDGIEVQAPEDTGE